MAAELTDEQIDKARDAFDWDGWIEPKNALRAFVREMIALSATGAEDAELRNDATPHEQDRWMMRLPEQADEFADREIAARTQS